MSVMAPELLVADDGAVAEPGDCIKIGAIFSLSLSAIGGPRVGVEYRLPLGSILIEVSDPVPAASAGGVIDLGLEIPPTSDRPRDRQSYHGRPEQSCDLGVELLTTAVPAEESPDEGWLTGTLLLPRASVEVRLTFQPPIGLVRAPDPAPETERRAAVADLYPAAPETGALQMLADHAESADPGVPAPASGEDDSHPSPEPSAATGEGMVGQLQSSAEPRCDM